MSHTLLKSFSAGAAISAYRLVKFSAAETVIQATAATDSIIGVANDVGAASGERQDVVMQGIAWVEAGAAISLGAFVTADANGRGVASAPSAGTNNRILGVALDAAGASGDQIRVLVDVGSYQG
ncbi:DUF2190 family protein [Accumulibacter sp.]|uniref:DUF2190 family protein n=1 Tax=Accumulibacter sp. TaxID=2053492 RepID=UPI0025D188B7|nr:DUF2190 family protein [Accumulibacter sp.]MCM8625527.1 DUF2190 family protein [Accumulibacter sp.]